MADTAECTDRVDRRFVAEAEELEQRYDHIHDYPAQLLKVHIVGCGCAQFAGNNVTARQQLGWLVVRKCLAIVGQR